MERLNRTLIDKVRATLHVANLPFQKYCAYCPLNTTAKTNCTTQSTISEIPLRLWNMHRSDYRLLKIRALNVDKFNFFGKYGHIPRLALPNSKQYARAALVRYLYTPDDDHNKVINPHSCQIMTYRIRNFKPYYPSFDPSDSDAMLYPERTRTLQGEHTPCSTAHGMRCTER